MNTIKASPSCHEITLGRQGENAATVVEFDVSNLRQTYGDGTPYLFHRRPCDAAAYPVAITVDGDTVRWVVTAGDTAQRTSSAHGQAELVWVVGETLAKTVIWRTYVGEALETGGETPPDAVKPWYNKLLDAIEDIRHSGVTEEQLQQAIEEWMKDHPASPGEKGEKGDDYVLTDADREEIAGGAAEKIKPEIDKVKDDLAQKVSDVQVARTSIVKDSVATIRSAYFAITEDIVAVTTDDTKGVAPYNTSYGYTNIQIDKDAGVQWIEGCLYSFIVYTKMVVASAYRNVRVRIGGEEDGDVWHPLLSTSAIVPGNSYLVKTNNTVWQYKSVYRSEGALHVQTDTNTTYPYLVNTVTGDSTTSLIHIDPAGYGARYSLIFPTTPLSDENGIVTDELWSSLVKSSSSESTKAAVSLIFYLDRHPLYVYPANISAGARAVNSCYQDYTGMDVRYTANCSFTYYVRNERLFLWLKDFDPETRSFKADATVGNVMSHSKIPVRFPSTTEGVVYLYFLGYAGSSAYTLTPAFTQPMKIYKYTPATGKLVPTDILVG